MGRLAADQRGVIIVMFALMVPIFLGFIGLGVEVGYWFQKHRDLQAAADAAAVSGAYENAEGRSSGVGTIAQREAVNNGWNSTDGTIAVRSFPFNAIYPASGSYTADADAVEIELTFSLARLFSSWFMSGDMIINARAVGDVVVGASEACILALGYDSSSSSTVVADALKVSGSATVTMSGCTAATNSTDNKAINVTSGLTVDCIYSAGNIHVSGSGNPTTTACASPGKTNQPTITDPYESLTKPVASDFDNCGSDGSNADGANYKAPPSTDYTLDPGVYCDINFGVNNTTLTLAAGTYYIDRGDFDVKSGGIIDGTAGVTIVFGDSTWDGTAGTSDCGRFNVSGSAYVNLTAPVTEDGEPFTGLAIYRNSDCDKGEKIEFTGTTTSTVLGAIYNPNYEIKVSGTGALDGTCLQLIGNTIELSGDSGIGSSCDDVDIQTVPAGGIGSLVE
ncbi:MAG: pilus assembly protein TadG-related protein [Rhodospirillales bacterium]